MSRKNYFYGERKKKCYFEGWYFKLSLIHI